MGSFSLTTLLLRPWLGRWTDRHGRRTLLVGGAVAFALVTTAHLLVDSVWALVLVRLLLGAAEACYFVAGFAALADLAPPARAGEALSLNSLALYTGIAVGPLLGQGLQSAGGYAAAWLGASGVVALAAVLAAAVPETSGARRSRRSPDAAAAPGDGAARCRDDPGAADHVGLHGLLGAALPRDRGASLVPGAGRVRRHGGGLPARVRPAARPGPGGTARDGGAAGRRRRHGPGRRRPDGRRAAGRRARLRRSGSAFLDARDLRPGVPHGAGRRTGQCRGQRQPVHRRRAHRGARCCWAPWPRPRDWPPGSC